MTTSGTNSGGSGITSTDETAVREAIGALEIADGLVPSGVFPALEDPALRKTGRHTPRGVRSNADQCRRRVDERYRDDVADALVELDIGVLAPEDRAVLVLILLRTVAIPRARGSRIGETWGTTDGAKGTSVDELALNRTISKTQIKESVRNLSTHGLVDRHRGLLFPGPALLRLTPARSTRLWEKPAAPGRTGQSLRRSDPQSASRSTSAGRAPGEGMTTLFDQPRAIADDTLGVIGDRQLVVVQTFYIARLTSHPVAIVPSAFVAVTGRGRATPTSPGRRVSTRPSHSCSATPSGESPGAGSQPWLNCCSSPTPQVLLRPATPLRIPDSSLACSQTRMTRCPLRTPCG